MYSDIFSRLIIPVRLVLNSGVEIIAVSFITSSYLISSGRKTRLRTITVYWSNDEIFNVL